MKRPPCKDCERKGCGSYHDECPEYLKWKEDTRRVKPESGCREYIKESTFRNRMNGTFKSTKK